MKRYLNNYILADLPHKIVLLMGARQCGKTTLAKQFFENYDYLNYDSAEDRLIFQAKSWDREKPLIIFDELHKMNDWKRWLKGIYDTEGMPPSILVTGSAKLDIFRNVGDSLAGRYFQFRLHPLDMKEITAQMDAPIEALFEQFWQCSGFPEPFLKGSQTYYKRWQQTHLQVILKQDLIDLHTIKDIKSIESLVLLLKQRVGSTISYANLARDLEKDPHTIKRWLQLLEELYVIYKVPPFHQNIARSLLKEPKYYFYDHAQIENNDPARLENIVANALLKELDFIQDTTGNETALHFVRTKDGREIDFLICINHRPTHLIEVKTADDNPASGFGHFESYFPDAVKLQLVLNLKREKTFPNGLAIRQLVPWLAKFDLGSAK